MLMPVGFERSRSIRGLGTELRVNSSVRAIDSQCRGQGFRFKLSKAHFGTKRRADSRRLREEEQSQEAVEQPRQEVKA